MENSKELIIKYFFNEHLKVKEIAEMIHTSSSYITKIIKQDERYSEEKKYRINKSKEKRKQDQNKFINVRHNPINTNLKNILNLLSIK